VNPPDPKAKRPYRMGARAKATAETRERILEASIEAYDQLPADQLTLAAVAERADVTVQTILRHFGDRRRLFEASVMHLAMKMGADRGLPPVGDVKGAVGPLIDHYEEFGDRIIRMLAQEPGTPDLQQLADLGRQYHAHWCEQAFAPALVRLAGADRARRLSQFIAITDIYMWKLLRRDRKLSRRQTKLALYELLEPLTKDTT
jgi:AcrR family transcriptional regulator